MRTKYEYETLTILSGTEARKNDLDDLGEMGYLLFETVPLTRLDYSYGETRQISNGSQLIFIREKVE